LAFKYINKLPYLQQKRSRTAGLWALCSPARFICLICSKKGRGRLGRGRCAAPPDSFALSATKKVEAGWAAGAVQPAPDSFALSATKKVEDGGAAGAVQPRPIHLPCLQQKMSRTAGPRVL